jgi:hypothetical protein
VRNWDNEMQISENLTCRIPIKPVQGLMRYVKNQFMAIQKLGFLYRSVWLKIEVLDEVFRV